MTTITKSSFSPAAAKYCMGWGKLPIWETGNNVRNFHYGHFIAYFSCPLRTLLPVSHVHYGDFVAYFSSPLRTLCCLFLISITDTVAWFSSPLDLANWTKSVFLGVKGPFNNIMILACGKATCIVALVGSIGLALAAIWLTERSIKKKDQHVELEEWYKIWLVSFWYS